MYIKCVHVFPKFQKNLMDGSNVMGQKDPFWPWGVFFYSFDPLGFTNQIFIRVKDTKIMCISSFFHVLRVSEKSTKGNKNYEEKMSFLAI